MATLVPRNFDGRFDNFNVRAHSPSASGCFPSHRSKTNKKGNQGKMADKATFKIVVKDGDTEYKLNKSGQYVSKVIDYVSEFSDLAGALVEFLQYVEDSYNEDKVSLVFVPAKKGKK